MDASNKAFTDKSKSLWDKLNTVFVEVKSIGDDTKAARKQTPRQPPNTTRQIDRSMMTNDQPRHRNECVDSIATDTPNTPGTYSNALKTGLRRDQTNPVAIQNRPIRNSESDHNPNNLINSHRANFHNLPTTPVSDRSREQRGGQETHRAIRQHNNDRRQFNKQGHSNSQEYIFPGFQKNDPNYRKNLLVIGSSTLKKMSARKMSSENINTKVKTIRGGRIKDIENCLVNYIADGRLDNVNAIAVHVGTNNVSDGDSVYDIIDDYKNIIDTVKQSLPNTKLLICSILPRPTNYQANMVISEVNKELLHLEENGVSILDNTLDFLYGNKPNQTMFEDHVHVNIAGTKVLSNNIILSICDMLNIRSNTYPNFHTERFTGRSNVPNTRINQQFRSMYPAEGRY